MRIQVVSSFRTPRLLAVAVAAAGGVALMLWQSGRWASDAFTDVADGNVHHDSTSAIAEAGVTLGCGEGRYCPADGVRRDQMASFMDRLGALSGQTPVVNAATAEQADDSAALGGTGAQELLDRIQALEERQGDGDLADSVEALKTQLADATSPDRHPRR